jgi:hypothetical protein
MNHDDAEEYTQALGQVVAGGWRQVSLGERLGVPEALGLTTRQWVNERLGGYVRLSVEERRQAALELKNEGLNQREIGDVLGVGHRTVGRDLGSNDPADEPESQAEPEMVGSNDPEPRAIPDDDPPASEPKPLPPPPDPAEVERARDEKERQQAIGRQVNRLRNLIDGWETVTHLRNNPLRAEVLDSIGEFDRDLILRIEEVINS